MSNVTVAMGALVLIIGIIGILGWVQAYGQISGSLSMLSSVEQTASTVSTGANLFSWIPFIGGVASGVGQVSESIAGVVYTLRMTVTVFFFYNMLLNIALIFTGIGLISVGRSASHSHSRVDKMKSYLMKNKSPEK